MTWNTDPFSEVEPILDFFETMALLLRRNALDPEMVKHTFFYWIDRYYALTSDQIQQRQQTNPLLWKDLTAMVKLLRKRNAVELGHASKTLTAEDLKEFLLEEQLEATL